MQLKTIKFIKENDNWRELLSQAPYCLTINEDENYAILKYSQIDSDFNEQICRECRGLVIDLHTLDPVALSFYKFFNVQETFADRIYWKDCKVLEKVDGSKMMVWYNTYENKWQISTSSQLDAYKARVNDFDFTFGDIFDRALLGYLFPNYVSLFEYLDKNLCYTFELVSPESRIVIPYKKPDLYFIGLRDRLTFEEIDPSSNELSKFLKTPKQYPFQNLKDCLNKAEHMGYDEEGFVVVDKYWKRIKIKSPAYVAAHYLRNNGVNSRSRILEIIENNEQSEFLGLFPEYTELFNEIEIKYKEMQNKIYDAIDDVLFKSNNFLYENEKEKRKELANYILTEHKELSGFLFKYLDIDPIEYFIKQEWRELSKDKKMSLLGYKFEKENFGGTN